MERIEGKILGIADCLSDWREEIITVVSGELRIYSTTIPSDTCRVCLMQGRFYRMGVVSASMAYLYPPQLGGIIMPQNEIIDCVIIYEFYIRRSK